MVHIWFKRLLIALGSVSTAFMFLLLGMLFFVPEDTALFEFLTVILGTMICSLPFILLGILATGLDILIKGNQKKKKAYDFAYELDNDSHLQYIMSKLSPEERAYLEERLAEREIGLGDDGEIISINDLLNEFEEKSKRK